jgi:hypothetical protein
MRLTLGSGLNPDRLLSFSFKACRILGLAKELVEMSQL